MEARVARIESDVTHIKDGLQKVYVELREFRSHLTTLSQRVAQVDGKIDTVSAETKGAMSATEARLNGRIDASEQRTDAKLHAMETRILKWFVGTAIALTGAAFSVAKFVN